MSSVQGVGFVGKLIRHVNTDLFLHFWRKGGTVHEANQDLAEQNRINRILGKALTNLLAAMLFIREYGTGSLGKTASFEMEPPGFMKIVKRVFSSSSPIEQRKKRQAALVDLVRKVFSAYWEILAQGIQRVSFFQVDENAFPTASTLVTSISYLEQGALCCFFSKNSLSLLPPMLGKIVVSSKKEFFPKEAAASIEAAMQKRRDLLFTFCKATTSEKPIEEEKKDDYKEVELDSQFEDSICDPPEKPSDIGTIAATFSQSRFSKESLIEQMLIPEELDQVCYEVGPISFAEVCRKWERENPSEKVGFYTILLEKTKELLKRSFLLRHLPEPLRERLAPPDFFQEGAETAFERVERFRSLLLFSLFPKESIEKLIEGFLGKYEAKEEEALFIRELKKIIREDFSLDLFFEGPELKNELIEIKFWVESFTILKRLIDSQRTRAIQSNENQDDLFKLILTKDIGFQIPASFYKGNLTIDYRPILAKLLILYDTFPEKRGSVFPLLTQYLTITAFREAGLNLGVNNADPKENIAYVLLEKAGKSGLFWEESFAAFEKIKQKEPTSVSGHSTFRDYHNFVIVLLLNREEDILPWEGGLFIVMPFLYILAGKMGKNQKLSFFDGESFTIFNTFCSLSQEARDHYLEILTFLIHNHPFPKKIVVDFCRVNGTPPKNSNCNFTTIQNNIQTLYSSLEIEIPLFFPENRHSFKGIEKTLFSPPKSWEELANFEMTVHKEDIFIWFLQTFQEKVGSWVDPSLFHILGDFLCKKVQREIIEEVFSFLEELKNKNIIFEITEQSFLGVYKIFLEEGGSFTIKPQNWEFVERLSQAFGFLPPVLSLNLLRYLPSGEELLTVLESYIRESKAIFRLYREGVVFFTREEIQRLEEEILRLIRDEATQGVWVKGKAGEEPRLQRLCPSEYELLAKDPTLNWSLESGIEEEKESLFTISEEIFQGILKKRGEIDENGRNNLTLELRSFFFRILFWYNPQSIEDILSIKGWENETAEFTEEHISTHKGHFFPIYEGCEVEVFPDWGEVEVGDVKHLRLRVAFKNIRTHEVQNVHSNLAILPEDMRPYLGSFLQKMTQALLKISCEEEVERKDFERDLLLLYPSAKRLYELYERGLYLENREILEKWSTVQREVAGPNKELTKLIKAISCHKRRDAIQKLEQLQFLQEGNERLFQDTKTYLDPEGLSEEEKENLFEAQGLFSTLLSGHFSKTEEKRKQLYKITESLLRHPVIEKFNKEAKAVLEFLIHIRKETRRAYVEVGGFLRNSGEFSEEKKSDMQRETPFHKAARGNHYVHPNGTLSLLPYGSISSAEILQGFSAPSFEELDIKTIRGLFFIETKNQTSFPKKLIYYSIVGSKSGKGSSISSSLRNLFSFSTSSKSGATSPKNSNKNNARIEELPISFRVTLLEETRTLVTLSVNSPFTLKKISLEVVYKKSDSDRAFKRKLHFQSLSLLSRVYEGVAF